MEAGVDENDLGDLEGFFDEVDEMQQPVQPPPNAFEQLRDRSIATKAKQFNWPARPAKDIVTHHRLNQGALATWIYPLNLSQTIRDYQFTITSMALYRNLLVALPTGLGKTFIAATVMYNWFRWTRDSQIIFVAPTKPLVAQQIHACYNIVGIPRSETCVLTGNTRPAERAEEWKDKRVFFCTPQVVINDLKLGIADPKRVVCVVVDEAHKAKGNYASVEMITFLRRFNSSFRVLALTATPGSSVESVQEVINSLGIAKVEIRMEDSIDIRQYVHERDIEIVRLDFDEDLDKLREMYAKVFKPTLDQLVATKAYYTTDPLSLTAYGLTSARQKWMLGAGRNINFGLKNKINSLFTLLAQFAHPLHLLSYHGVGPFYRAMERLQTEMDDKGNKLGKIKKAIKDDENYQGMMNLARLMNSDTDCLGHPKMDYLVGAVLEHFTEHSELPTQRSTRIMIFAEYRDSADEIVQTLARHEPMIKPKLFVGQMSKLTSKGMQQGEQVQAIKDFQAGRYNTLVATCIGEEGLDIGEVDLIICYDSSSSPIRMIQRMGRTGRKRAGKIKLLLMKGKEEEKFQKAKDGYKQMQRAITEGSRFEFPEHQSPRIIPKGINPVVDKKQLEIPLENTQAVEPKKKKKVKKVPAKRPSKKFNKPDNAREGFVTVSKLLLGDADDLSVDDELDESVDEDLAPLPNLDDGFLDGRQMEDLEQRFADLSEEEVRKTFTEPRLDQFPAWQRLDQPAIAIAHGARSKRLKMTINAMHQISAEKMHNLQSHLHPDDEKMIDEACGTGAMPTQPSQDEKVENSPYSEGEDLPTAIDFDSDTPPTSHSDCNELIIDQTAKESQPLSKSTGLHPKFKGQIEEDDSDDLPEYGALLGRRIISDEQNTGVGRLSASKQPVAKKPDIPPQRKRPRMIDSDDE